MSTELELISHHLCPYVQRAAIVLAEKGIPFRRTMIDLAAKPDWFVAISPLGKVPLLRSGAGVLFESAAIVDYLDEVYVPALHPANPFARAQHRGWIAVASATLDAIGGLYNAPEASAFDARVADLEARFLTVEAALGDGPFFAGVAFSMVDAAFAPIFRYFDVLEHHLALGVFAGKPKVARWRKALAARPSVRAAVDADYPQRLDAFFRARNSHLGRLLNGAVASQREPA